MKPSAVVTGLALIVGLGCSQSAGPPPIPVGSACAACGMTITDLRFACERETGRTWHAYDSIECLLGEAASADRCVLADYDSKALHDADSLWLVHGAFPSPMGGGYAAFVDRAAADTVAARTQGEVRRFASPVRAARARS